MDEAAPSIPGVPFGKFPLEIQSQIANHLEKKSLFNAILVNKEWFLRLIDLLWHTASINTVSRNPTRIRTKSRRQYYAAKIRKISIGSEYDPGLHESLEFHSVQHLDVYGFNTADETWLFPLLRSTLQSINVRVHCDLNTRVLDRLQNCTQLQELALNGLVRPCNEEKLMAYLREAPSLRVVTLQSCVLYYTGYETLLNKMLNALLRRGNLKNLVVCSELPENCFDEHLSTPTESFPPNANLKRLHLEVYSPAILVCLSTATDRLYRLDLVLLDPGHNVFKYLHNFPNLSKLSLTLKLERRGAPINLLHSHLEIL
ncbi:hypothetical protein KCU67_g9430, partial [Aureobasidium melanogenum]